MHSNSNLFQDRLTANTSRQSSPNGGGGGNNSSGPSSMTGMASPPPLAQPNVAKANRAGAMQEPKPVKVAKAM